MSSTLKCATLRAPDLPSRMRDQVSSTPQASGVTIPSPVTTTRRMYIDAQMASKAAARRALSSRLLFDELDRIADSHDRLGRVVRNFDVEFLFERHDELNSVQAVRAEIVDEACVFGDLFRFNV